MSATTFPSRVSSAPPRGAAAPAAGRLLWIEIKRNPVLWALPLLALLFFFDAYRHVDRYPPIWTVRASEVPDRLLFDFAAFAGGFSAWAGSREGRRKTEDLLGTTVRPAWARQLTALAATMFWLMLAFLAAVAVLYAKIASAVSWGGPPLWPVAVGVTGLVTIGVVGFTCGVLFPGRFTAPLVAIGAVLVHLIGTHPVNQPGLSSPHDLLSLSTSLPAYDMGVFFHVPLDVPIAQIMFMGGITLAALGLLALKPALRRPAGVFSAGGTGRWLAGVSLALVAAGVAASVTAYDLTGTAKLTAAGWEIPALHDAAADRPVPYTPDCASSAGSRVCVHPAFGGYLAGVAAAFDPVAGEIAGLPGAPARAEQVANGDPFYGDVITGTPPVYEFTVTPNWVSSAVVSGAVWRVGFQQGLLDEFFGVQPDGPGTPAQQAVVSALLTAVGSSTAGPGYNGPPPAAQVTVAANRFAALSSAARHAWLAAHLSALQAGHITLAQLP
jgi:hypothetical protein